MREIRIQLPARNGGRIDLSFEDRRGEIQVRARTQTQADALPLRLNLDELRQSLGEQGLATEMHLPSLHSESGAVPELPLRSTEPAEPRLLVAETRQAASDLSNPSGDGGRGNRNAMGRWVDQLEDSIDGPALQRTAVGNEDSE